MLAQEKVYSVLENLKIDYKKYTHPPVYTVEEVKKLNLDIDDCGLKNLFLKNKKGTEHYLVIAKEDKRVDLKKLASNINTSSLSFASSERLEKYLKITPGSVTPFAIMNDEDKKVKLILDKDILKEDKLGFHPNVNTETLVINLKDFIKFLDWSNNKYEILDI